MPDPTDVQAMTDAANGVSTQRPERLAKAIYVAYFNDCGGRSVNGTALPLWEEQDDAIRDHWIASAEAAERFLGFSESRPAAR